MDADPDFFAQIVSQFVTDVDNRLDQLRDALQTGDARSAGSIAHSLKGSSAAVGGRRLALACARLEKKASTGRLAGGRGDISEVEDECEQLRRTLARELAAPL